MCIVCCRRKFWFPTNEWHACPRATICASLGASAPSNLDTTCGKSSRNWRTVRCFRSLTEPWIMSRSLFSIIRIFCSSASTWDWKFWNPSWSPESSDEIFSNLGITTLFTSRINPIASSLACTRERRRGTSSWSTKIWRWKFCSPIPCPWICSANELDPCCSVCTTPKLLTVSDLTDSKIYSNSRNFDIILTTSSFIDVSNVPVSDPRLKICVWIPSI